MSDRYFFHLSDCEILIPDCTGVVAEDMNQVNSAAAQVIKEFTAKQAFRSEEWKDWNLIITDEAGRFALILPIAP